MALFFLFPKTHQKFHSTTPKLLIIYGIVKRRDSIITATSFFVLVFISLLQSFGSGEIKIKYENL